MGLDSLWHWGLLLVIVMLIFGTRKFSNVGSDLGHAIRGFKQAMRGDDEAAPTAATERLQATPPTTPHTPTASHDAK